jgi:hypothetical protein
MLPGENTSDSHKNYKDYEVQLHRELTNSCRKYSNTLSIVSILGILEIVKQETIEFEQATKNTFNQNVESEQDIGNF